MTTAPLPRWRRKSARAAVIVWTSTLDDTCTDIAAKPDLPAARASARALRGALRASDVVGMHGGPGPRPHRPRESPPRPHRGDALRRAAESHLGAAKAPKDCSELNEQGIYEVRSAAGVAAAGPEAIAVNLDPAESGSRARSIPSELIATVTGHASHAQAQAPEGPQEMTREESEKRQSLWWYFAAWPAWCCSRRKRSSRIACREKRNSCDRIWDAAASGARALVN